MGMFYSPNSSAVLSTVDRSMYGVATAYLNMIRNAATVTGIALAVTVVTVIMSSKGFEPSLDAVSAAGAASGVKGAFTDGLRLTYMVMSGVVVGAAALAALAGTKASGKALVVNPEHHIPSKI